MALRPVEVVFTDYALQEYGLRPEEMVAAEKRITAELKPTLARGELSPLTVSAMRTAFYAGGLGLG